MDKQHMKVIAKTIALSLFVASLVATGGLTGCAGDQTEKSTGEYIDDAGTTGRVKSALGDDTKYKFEDVKVTTFKGTVQLSGFVNSAEQKSRAEEIARQVRGTREVVNNITVRR
jgi:hyperosmotically inducible periplasmic protein